MEELIRKAKALAGRLLVLYTCLAVCRVCSLNLRHTHTDNSLCNNECRLAILHGFGLGNGLIDGRQVMPINVENIPAQSLEFLGMVHRLGEISHLVQGDIIGIIDDDEIVKTIMASEGGCFKSHTFLQAAITTQGDNVVIKDLMILGVVLGGCKLGSSSHTHRVANARTERSSGGLDPGCVVLRRREFRMTRRHGFVTAKLLDLIQRKIVAGQVQPGIDEHGAMAS
mmetsp:Transcript_120559/g.232660  ORF Transcript_120559/g.232660 Transcript_120559/m.232660 type:complete len:226 (+) Transcript_120559:1203-1880(+)